MSSPNQTAQPAAGGNPFLQSYQAWAVRTPVVTRYSTIVLTIVYILTWFFSLESLFANVPFYTLFYFEVYRLILSPLVGNSLLTLILVYLVYPSLGVKMETSMGSAAFLYLIVFFTLAVNVLFLLVCLLFVMLQQSSLGWVSMDFWTLLFALITLDCMQMPDMPRRLMFIPVDISSKYIPLVLYFILCLFSGFVLSYALSLAVGYLWMRGTLDYFRPSSQFLERQESEGGWLFRPSRISGWVLAGSLGHDAWIPVNTVDPSDHGSSAHGGQSQGGTYFGGAGGPRGSSDGQNPMHEGGQQPTAFPGSGRKLADSSSSTSAPSSSSYFGLPVAAASFGGTVARPPSAVVVPVATPVSSGALPSREEIAARRLAALEAQQRNFGNMASAPPLPSDHNHNNV